MQIRRMLIALAVLAWGCAPSVVDQQLLRASMAGNTKAVQAALDAGASANASDQEGLTALMLASRASDAEAVKALLAHGADPNESGPSGDTALMECADSITDILLKAGADPNKRNWRGWTALMGASAEKTRILLAAHVDPDQRDSSGHTPLMWADPEKARLLVRAGANVEARSDNGTTPLLAAAASEPAGVVALLLEAGAKIDARDREGRTVLHAAATNLRRGVIEELVRAGAAPYVNAQMIDGRTPLLIAVRDGYTENVRSLLDAGADPNAEDGAGNTALQWAEGKGDHEIVALLRDAGAAGGSAKPLAELRKAAHAAERGYLDVRVLSALTTGRIAKFRGYVTNLYGREVRGVRYTVRLYLSDGARQIDALQETSKATIPPGGTLPLHLDFDNTHLSPDTHFTVDAAPLQLEAPPSPSVAAP